MSRHNSVLGILRHEGFGSLFRTSHAPLPAALYLVHLCASRHSLPGWCGVLWCHVCAVCVCACVAIHRLDRWTSGLTLLARDAPTAAKWSRQLQQQQFTKTYLAYTAPHQPTTAATTKSAATTAPAGLSGEERDDCLGADGCSLCSAAACPGLGE